MYLIRRLLIAIPSHARDQRRAVHRAGAGAGRSVRRAGHQSGGAAGSARRHCAPSSASMTRCWIRYVRWFTAMLHGDWGFSFVSRMDVDTLILQRLPTTLVVIGAAQLLAILVALPVGVLAGTRPYSIFDQIANTLAFIGFSLPTFFTGLLLILVFSDPARLAAVRLPRRPERHRLALVLGAHPAVDHAGHGARPCSRAPRWRATCAPRCSTSSASTTSPRRAPRASASARSIIKHVVRNALIPVVTLVALQMPAIFGGAIVTEQIFRVPGIGSLLISVDPRQRHAGGHGGDLRVRLPRRPLQPHRRHPLWLARPPHHFPLRHAARRPRARSASAQRSRRGSTRGGGSAATGWRWRAPSMLLAMVAAILLGPFLWRVPINEIDFTATLQGPSWQHPFGTDDLGQDLLARMLYGGRISLAVGLRRHVRGHLRRHDRRRHRRHVARLGRRRR